MWLVQVDDGIMKSDTFGSLPQAAWGRGGRTVMVPMREYATRLGTLNSRIPSLYNVA